MDTYTHSTLKVLFDSYVSAAEGLLTVLEDARSTTSVYTIHGLSIDQILKNGLILSGDVDDISSKVGLVVGSTLIWQ